MEEEEAALLDEARPRESPAPAREGGGGADVQLPSLWAGLKQEECAAVHSILSGHGPCPGKAVESGEGSKGECPGGVGRTTWSRGAPAAGERARSVSCESAAPRGSSPPWAWGAAACCWLRCSRCWASWWWSAGSPPDRGCWGVLHCVPSNPGRAGPGCLRGQQAAPLALLARAREGSVREAAVVEDGRAGHGDWLASSGTQNAATMPQIPSECILLVRLEPAWQPLRQVATTRSRCDLGAAALRRVQRRCPAPGRGPGARQSPCCICCCKATIRGPDPCAGICVGVLAAVPAVGSMREAEVGQLVGVGAGGDVERHWGLARTLSQDLVGAVYARPGDQPREGGAVQHWASLAAAHAGGRRQLSRLRHPRARGPGGAARAGRRSRRATVSPHAAGLGATHNASLAQLLGAAGRHCPASRPWARHSTGAPPDAVPRIPGRGARSACVRHGGPPGAAPCVCHEGGIVGLSACAVPGCRGWRSPGREACGGPPWPNAARAGDPRWGRCMECVGENERLQCVSSTRESRASPGPACGQQPGTLLEQNKGGGPGLKATRAEPPAIGAPLALPALGDHSWAPGWRQKVPPVVFRALVLPTARFFMAEAGTMSGRSGASGSTEMEDDSELPQNAPAPLLRRRRAVSHPPGPSSGSRSRKGLGQYPVR